MNEGVLDHNGAAIYVGDYVRDSHGDMYKVAEVTQDNSRLKLNGLAVGEEILQFL